MVVLCFVALFLAYANLLQPVLQNGDSAVYNQQIDDRNLSERTSHIGYFALGIVFNALLPFGTELNMNIMVLSVGFLGLAAVYLTAKLLGQSRWAALTPVVVALGLPSQVEGMLLSEVDVLSVAFVAMAFACYLRGAAMPAGALFGFAVLVTPLSGPLLVLFILTANFGNTAGNWRAPLRRILEFGGAAVLIYAPAVLTHYQDYVHGPRGILNAPRSAFTLSQRVAHSVHFITTELGLMLPFYVIGAALCLVSPRLKQARLPAIALLVSTILMAAVGERFVDVPVQLPNLVLLGILPAVALASSARGVGFGLLVLFALCFVKVQSSYAGVRSEIGARAREREICLSIREQSGPRVPVLVALKGWGQSRMFERLTSSREQRAITVDWRRFMRDQRGWLEPPGKYQFWFFRDVRKNQVEPLLEGYSLESRRAGPRALKVLVPRAR